MINCDKMYNKKKTKSNVLNWWVVSIPLKNVRPLGWLFPTYGKNKGHVHPKSQPDILLLLLLLYLYIAIYHQPAKCYLFICPRFPGCPRAPGPITQGPRSWARTRHPSRPPLWVCHGIQWPGPSWLGKGVSMAKLPWFHSDFMLI